ncbi:hypothetical protein ES692_04900 [Psychroserpens burtonensis]|uniref:Uncharacterized protein n=1 Tax=Psychroserpens burtonensis TaxID=49278 RepID=A0A5C7BIE1_9FLAO|nr:DUF6090 family protein [Psychroserpens burtonensis]TXE18792.1 hypothetical protein ES692_04900 [Psychroserpens burtonensis]
MIKLFRNIRKQLLSEGKNTKYFKYAIGEIVLVVIGILIALQINNWKEHKQKEIQIKNALVALYNDLAQDTVLIKERLPFIKEQHQLNESLRTKVAKPEATLDTLIHVMRYEFNPNWSEQIIYNTNAYYSLIQTGLVENVSDSLKTRIKNFYNQKFFQKNRVEKTTNDYREKITSYVNTYTFGSTPIHDQGHLIDSLVWEHINSSHLAATFQGISNFKRILFTETQVELEYSLEGSKRLLQQLDFYIKDL